MRHAARARGGPPDRRAAHRLRVDDLGLLGHARRVPPRVARAAPARASLHGDEAGRRAVLPLLRRALRRRAHDPAVRHPVRSARPPGRGPAGVHGAGTGRRADDHRRRRLADAALRLCRGPGRRRRARARARRGEPDVQPRRDRGHVGARDRAGGPRGRRRGGDRARPRTDRRLRRRSGQLRTRAGGARLDGDDAVRRGRPPLRRGASVRAARARARCAPADPGRDRAAIGARARRRAADRARDHRPRHARADRLRHGRLRHVRRCADADAAARAGRRVRVAGARRARDPHRARRGGRGLARAGAAAVAVRARAPAPRARDAARAVRALSRPRRSPDLAQASTAGMAERVVPALDRFAIGFDERDRARLHELWDEVIASQRWSEGPLTTAFERAWAAWNGLESVAFSGWTGAALAALEFAGVRGETVLVPSNTFMATPLAALHAGARVEFVDCGRDDLCMSFASLEAAVARHRPRAVMLVHIGGHIAFETERIAELCRAEGIFLIEDCAHAHGAAWDGRRPGTFGDAGVWSFYATKTISTGEGGMLVSRDPDVLSFARAFRNYGKPGYEVSGLNFRLSEFTAALGIVQTERLEEIVAWKNRAAREHLDPVHPGRLALPDGMVSGLYKYIVFDPVERSTGKVYAPPCHRLMGHAVDLPNSDWIAEHHWCVPLYYRP